VEGCAFAKDREYGSAYHAPSHSPQYIERHLDELIPTLDEQDMLGRSALHVASQQGRRKLVSVLLKAGADHWLQIDIGNVPLHYAATEGFTEICSALLRTKPDEDTVKFNLEDDWRYSPLHYAFRQEQLETAICLLESAIFDVGDKSEVDRASPLDLASTEFMINLGKKLIERGATDEQTIRLLTEEISRRENGEAHRKEWEGKDARRYIRRSGLP
jgi:ankyrin repeat protein